MQSLNAFSNFFRNEKLEIVENKDILIDLVFTDIESLIGLTFKKFLCRIIRSKNSSKQTLSVVRRNVDQSKSFFSGCGMKCVSCWLAILRKP